MAELYAEHAKFVWRNLQRLGIPPDHIEDAVQDVFLAAQQALQAFEGRSAVRTWLFSIMARIAARRCERLRITSHRFVPVSPELLDTLVENEHSPLDLLLQRQAIELGHRLLSELDYDKRTILVMVELEQMSVVEAAEALGINLNTAHSRLRAGRRLLEERLKESLAEPKVAS